MEAVLNVVCFHAGEWRFAMEARLVRSMGAVKAENASEAAETIEALLGLPPRPSSIRRILWIGDTSIEVSEPVEQMSLAAGCLYPLPELVAARISLPGIRAIAFTPCGAILILGQSNAYV